MVLGQALQDLVTGYLHMLCDVAVSCVLDRLVGAGPVHRFTQEGLPVGMQIVGRRFDDAAVLAASAAIERVRPWHDSYDALGKVG